MNYSMPMSKKRCWTLLLRDVKKRNAEESEVLSSFRKKYTSARRLSFRSPTAHEIIDTTSRGIEGDILSIDLQFTGPQPIEGPAGLLCKLLQASFAAAHPVQLGRGRKRKVRPGAAAPPALVVASTSSGSSGEMGTTGTSSRSNTGASTRTSGPMAGARASSTSNGASGGGSGSGSGGGSGALSDVGTVQDTAASEHPAKRPSIRLPSSWQEPETSRGGSFTAFSSAFGGSSREIERPADRAANGNNTMYSFPTPARLRRSCGVMTAAKDDLPAWDDVVRSVDTPSTSSCSSSEDERHPSPNHSKGTTDSQTPSTAETESRPPSAPVLAADNSYEASKENIMTSQEIKSLLGDIVAATSGGTTTSCTAVGGAEDDLSDTIPEDDDGGDGDDDDDDDDDDTLFRRPPLGRHSSSSWALHPIHTGASTPVSDDNDGVDGGAGAQTHERHVVTVGTAAEGKPETGEHGVSFAWREEECDFDGWPSKTPPCSEENNNSPGDQYPFTFHGLERAAQGYGLRELTFRAQFFIDAKGSNVAQRVANLFEDDASGRAHANTTYPSIQEIWPEVYGMINITAIEVSMVIEVWSSDENFVLTGPTLKVMYRRP